MRWLLDAAVVVTALGVLVAVLMYQREQEKHDAEVGRAGAAVRRFELEVKYRAASRIGELNARGWPVTIEPTWFDGDPPRNILLGPEYPWVEVATIEQAELLHPPVRMAVTSDLAGFWYNPFQGIVRARVPVMVSDSEAVQVYNQINDCALTSIFQTEGSLQLSATPAKADAKPVARPVTIAEDPDAQRPTDGSKVNKVEMTVMPQAKQPPKRPGIKKKK